MPAGTCTGPQLHQQLWAELETALGQRQHGWRTPVLATVDQTGLPQARTVVLREVDRQRQTLCIYTDQRSPKVAELMQRATAALVFWCPQRNWQLRVQASASIDTGSARVAAVWQSLQHSRAAADYRALSAPGSPLTGTDLLPAHQHALAILTLHVHHMDWLELSSSGHRRALLSGGQVQWCVP
jgi:hypothetical protein